MALDDFDWALQLASGPGPKFRQVVQTIRAAVRSGRLMPGQRLPAVRDLAVRLGVTPGVVARAYQVAAQEGVIVSHVGRGSFVSPPGRATPDLEPMLSGTDTLRAIEMGTLDLRLPKVADVGQVQLLDRALVQAQDVMGDMLRYPGLQDDGDCRTAMAGFLSGDRLGRVQADDLVMTLGGQNGMMMILSLLLQANPAARPAVMTEALSYTGLVHAARMARAELIPIAMDTEGALPDALDRAARETGARVICLTPSAQNPTAACMSEGRRLAILRVAARYDLQIVEDDCLTPGSVWLDQQAEPPAPTLRRMAPDRVWHLSSLAKTFSPALRTGAIVCPTGKGMAGRLAAQHMLYGLPATHIALIQMLAASPELVQMTTAVTARHAATVVQMHDLLTRPGGPQDGPAIAADAVQCRAGVPFIWLRTPEGALAETLSQAAKAAGVVLRTTREFAVTPRAAAIVTGGEGVRLAVDCNASPEHLAAGVAVLRNLWARAAPECQG